MSKTKHKSVVTGGSGFIGSHIAERLLALGHNVVIIDDLSTGRRENMSTFEDKIDFVRGSILDRKLLSKVFSGADYVFHQAAIPSVPKSLEDPHGTREVNVIGTQNVFYVARDVGVSRVVYASSSAVYGDSKILPKKEDMKVKPLSPYATHKMLCEKNGKQISLESDLETVGLRYFNVFGPRQDPNSSYAAVIPLFIRLMQSGESPTIFGDGETSRDFTYVSDIVDANIKASTSENISGEVFNIAYGKETSLNELVATINKLIGSDIKPQYADFRAGDIKHSLADISKAKKLFGYNPKVNFEKGLMLTAATL